MKKALILTLSKDNIIQEMILCESQDELEDRFADEFLERGIEPCDINFEEAYFEFEDGITVSMSTAYPSDKKPSGLRNIPDETE